nr:PD-(D/E)XK nuclease family protein [Gammaproteobacteria bacterium]
AEDVRLFYVAMTRARYRCYVGMGHIKGVGSSAIAHCLYPDMIRPGKYPRDLQLDYPDDLRRPFVKINSNKPRIQIVEKEVGISAITHEKGKPITLTKALEFKRVIKRMWRISSYSQIASQHEDVQIDRPDYDALAEPITETEKSSDGIIQDRFSFFKGAKAGTFLHDILEQSDFIKAMDETLVHDKCREYGYPIEWVRPVKNWLQDVINTELDGFSLSDIKNDRKLTEMEFYLTSDSLDADKLNDLLIQQGYLQSERKFNFNVLKGYLKGFIDLIFEYQGQYYIADYKSNYLGSEINDYTPAHCTSAMHQHHYHLQYLIYTLALHRYLQQRLDDYDYTQHMGGIYYLFLRGMSTSNPGTEKIGIYFDKPPAELIEQFDQLF